MATKTIIAYRGRAGLAELDWDDQTRRLLELRITNLNPDNVPPPNNGLAIKFNLTTDETKRWPTDGSFHIVAPGPTEVTPIPPNIANSLPLTVSTVRGIVRADNLNTEAQFGWPVP